MAQDESNPKRFVYVFSGGPGRSPGGVFSDLAVAEQWIRHYGLSGLLSKYPLDTSVFDWVKLSGNLSSKTVEALTPQQIGGFCSHMDHFHYENGEKIS